MCGSRYARDTLVSRKSERMHALARPLYKTIQSKSFEKYLKYARSHPKASDHSDAMVRPSTLLRLRVLSSAGGERLEKYRRGRCEGGGLCWHPHDSRHGHGRARYVHRMMGSSVPRLSLASHCIALLNLRSIILLA